MTTQPELALEQAEALLIRKERSAALNRNSAHVEDEDGTVYFFIPGSLWRESGTGRSLTRAQMIDALVKRVALNPQVAL